ncbi:MAG: hypothetical protein WC979_06070 [Candidatus Pacearchaeota archaeon]|jgi:hypothetical protein
MEKTTLKRTFETITNSEEFKKFREEYPDAELCTGFFVTDFFGNDNKKSLDYKLGERVFSFVVNELEKIKMYEDKLVKVENKEFPKLEVITPDIKVDLDEITEIAMAKTLENGICSKFSKIIAVLQKYKHNEKDIQAWNLTCMLEGLIIIHIMIDSDSGEIIKFERKSMMDLIKKK